jgi:purine-nucleoside phosphorylase
VSDPQTAANDAATAISEQTGVPAHDIAVVLGSGWAPALSALGEPSASVAMADLPGFTPPTAAGHGGQVHSVIIGAHRVLVLVGRIHAYEGHDLRHVVHPVRTACAAGAGTVILTNAAGMTGQPLSHDEVLEAGRQSAARMGALLAGVIARL